MREMSGIPYSGSNRVCRRPCPYSIAEATDEVAESPTKKAGPRTDGIGHVLMTPEDLIPVLAISLYAGLRGAAAGRRAMFLMPLAWLAGGLVGLMFSRIPPLPVPVLSFLVVGVFVAADLQMPPNAVSALAILIGLVHGFFNGAALKEGQGIPGLLGMSAMLFVLIAPVRHLLFHSRNRGHSHGPRGR